ncbi:MAG: ABC transporter permease subunit [Alteromonadaceae bacterium]|nr:ABC transporter permease subunit [Alteromonadaceae bacterium]
MWKRFYALFKARNLEFFRDRSSLAWNIIFPLLILIGFSFIFDGDGKAQYKVGVLGQIPEVQNNTDNERHNDFYQLKYVEFVSYEDESKATQRVEQHQVDLLVAPLQKTYWLNESSPKGYFVEQLLLGAAPEYQRITLSGKEIRYLDWVLPGILGMNMMFSCLFGVGYVIVRYRKSSVLKRLKATPLHAIEFILAQIISRLFIVVFMAAAVFVVCDFMFDFYMLGSYLNLLIVAFLGALCMISLGLLMASRSRSEELAGGMLNMVTWPMMILSGVWFSMEGAPEWIQTVALALPLTHLVDSARSIMTEGTNLWELKNSVFALLGMTAVFLTLSAYLFRWEGDGR